MRYETLLVNLDDHVAMVRMNRAESMNALEYRLRADLVDCLQTLSEDDEVRVVILIGSGNAFCAGGDLRELRHKMKIEQARKYVLHVSRVILAIQKMEKPVIAAVNGAAMGAGFSIVMACDLVVASETARFSQSFVHVGLIPDLGGTYFTPRVFGLQRAKEFAFTGKILSSNEIARLGLINQIVSPEELENKAIELAHQIVEGPPLALELTKKLLNQSWNPNLEEMIELEAQYQAACMQSEDHMKGIRAFYEKRKAKFKGR
ncbi:MAG: hypothetical protein B1H11_05555 [Desulfobacteraceae bacterium 4484_190.1]|nr:MAG: hypothetical protein B1H11_05555 [Desulfobacteraceae bacterium 4484_190.1]